MRIINKTMDRDDLDTIEAVNIIEDLNLLIDDLRTKSVKISSWWGTFELSGRDDSLEVINRGFDYRPLPNAVDDDNFPWFLYWEIVWLVKNNNFEAGQSVLDLGGSSSLFSYYLASKGLKVVTVDLQQSLVENANITAKMMNWTLDNFCMDIRNLNMSKQFDHVTSVCVFEHIPMYDRIEINEKIKEMLKPGGNFSITFDYRNPAKNASINTPKDIYEQFVVPSSLSVRGNMDFYDNGKNYLLSPFYSDKVRDWKNWCVENGLFDESELGIIKTQNDYTFGALFLTNK